LTEKNRHDGISGSDYTRCPVPDTQTVNWFGIATVVFGIGITLPVFYIGSELTMSLGFKKAALVFMVSCGIVGIMMAVTSVVAARTRLSTYMILHFTFGETGVKPINILLAITYIGYFAATGDIFGRAVHESMLEFYGWNLPVPACAALGSTIMALTAVFGFRIVERFSTMAVPVLAIFMIYVVYLATKQTNWSNLLAIPGRGGIDFGHAISTVIGANILMAVAAPDFTRYAKTDRDAIKTVSGLVLGYPLLMLSSGIPTLITGETDIMRIMISLHVALPALIILVFATWTTNTVNLYSGILTLSTVFTATPHWKIAAGTSAIGILGAALGVMDYFVPFVFFLGIATAPVAGIYLADFFVLNKGKRQFQDLKLIPNIGIPAYIAWLAGSGTAYLTTYTAIQISTIPAADGLLIALVSFIVCGKLAKNSPNHSNSND